MFDTHPIVSYALLLLLALAAEEFLRRFVAFREFSQAVRSFSCRSGSHPIPRTTPGSPGSPRFPPGGAGRERRIRLSRLGLGGTSVRSTSPQLGSRQLGSRHLGCVRLTSVQWRGNRIRHVTRCGWYRLAVFFMPRDAIAAAAAAAAAFAAAAAAVAVAAAVACRAFRPSGPRSGGGDAAPSTPVALSLSVRVFVRRLAKRKNQIYIYVDIYIYIVRRASRPILDILTQYTIYMTYTDFFWCDFCA